MFSELPKLLDRDFAVGFFVPAAILAAAVWTVLAAFDMVAKPANLDVLSSTAIAIIVVWVLSILLMALNYSILTFLEGYTPKWHPLKWRERVEKAHFRRKIMPVLQRQREIEDARKRGEEPEVSWEHADSLLDAVERYPDSEEAVLPTAFGNLFRAVEGYALAVYGIDAIPVWPRLLAVMPEEYRGLLARSKSQLDFCVNLSVAGATTAAIYVASAIWSRHVTSFWILLIAIAESFAMHFLAKDAVLEYGIYVKGAFDLYRSELAKQLGLALPRSITCERKMWRRVSGMMIYHSKHRANELQPFRSSSGQDGDTLGST
jgi:hypothetical protein